MVASKKKDWVKDRQETKPQKSGWDPRPFEIPTSDRGGGRCASRSPGYAWGGAGPRSNKKNKIKGTHLGLPSGSGYLFVVHRPPPCLAREAQRGADEGWARRRVTGHVPSVGTSHPYPVRVKCREQVGRTPSAEDCPFSFERPEGVGARVARAPRGCGGGPGEWRARAARVRGGLSARVTDDGQRLGALASARGAGAPEGEPAAQGRPQATGRSPRLGAQRAERPKRGGAATAATGVPPSRRDAQGSGPRRARRGPPATVASEGVFKGTRPCLAP